MNMSEMVIIQIHFRRISLHISVLPFEAVNLHGTLMLIPQTVWHIYECNVMRPGHVARSQSGRQLNISCRGSEFSPEPSRGVCVSNMEQRKKRITDSRVIAFLVAATQRNISRVA
jgi:hypothetical protein